MNLIRRQSLKNSYSKQTAGNINGRNSLAFLLSLSVFSLSILGLFNCSFQEKNIIEEAYEHYITQDTVSLFELTESISSDTSNREYKILNQFSQLSKGDFKLNHGLKDTSNVWYKLLESRKHYLNGNINIGYKIIRDAYLDMDNYPWHVRCEISFRFLELSRHTPNHNRLLLNNTLLRCEQLKSNVTIQNSSELINLLYHAELQKDYGNTKHSQNMVILVLQTINALPFEIPEIRALAMSILSALSIEESNISAEATLNKLMQFTEKYPLLKFYNSNALSNISYLNQINGNHKKANTYNKLALFKSQHIPLAHNYALQNSIYNKINAKQYTEALSLIDENMNNGSVNQNKIILQSQFLKAKVTSIQAPSKAYQILRFVIREASEYKSIKGLAAFELAKLHFNNKNTSTDSCLKYLTIFKHQFDDIYNNEISIHYSDIYHQYTSILLDCLYEKSINTISQELSILNAMEYGKNQSIKFRETNTSLSQYNEHQTKYLKMAETNYINYENDSDYINFMVKPNNLKEALDYSRSLLTFSIYPNIETTSFEYNNKGLNPNQLILSYFYTGEYYYTAAISNQSIDIGRISSHTVDSLCNKTNKYLSKLTRSDESIERESLKALFEKLIRPFTSKGTSDITILPDHLLYTIPYESFIDERGKFLIETNDVSYSTSLQKSLSKEIKTQNKSISILSYTDIETYKSRDVKEYPELRHAQTEVDAIVSNTNKVDIRIFQGSEMTKDALNKSLQSDIIHIITHAKSNQNIVSDNYFLLRDNNGNPVKEYGFNLKDKAFSSSLIILSGCETGVGKFVFGEGTKSLSRQFLESGAQNVVKSLWSINDTHSHHLFELFYHYHKKHSYKKALSKAKRTLIFESKNKASQSPHFWSSYVLIN